MHEHDADLPRVERRKAPGDPPREVVQLGDNFHPGESAAGDDEGEKFLAQARVVLLDGGFLDGADDTVSHLQRVLQVLERQRVLGEPAQAAEVGDVAEREHQVVEREHVRVRLEARRGRHSARSEIDPHHIAHVQFRARQEVLQRADQIREADRSADDLRQHRLEDEVVLLGDEDQFHVVARTEPLLERRGGEDAAETAAEDHDALLLRRGRALGAEDTRNARVVNDLRAAAAQGQ